ncbi:M42 family metallopeptidase [Halarchaeum nitratireducens]|uniref:Peptidase M42 n=1 Tax=Halarchaeum nitratireducens TaxID=489913 RepID=A0A830GD48_9EURY|nr:M42 family metallopeptidase [Halarchaeum nitratireducens]GGN18439.1 peptidase M42 [Halarchaeum nitratireducens]
MDADFDLLTELTEAHGAPGHEDRIRAIVRRELDDVADAIRTDAMGNVVATIEGSTNPDYEVAVAAHMDEIGFMVKHVTDEGFLRLDALGGWDPRVLRAQRVTVHAAEGDLEGVIGSPPPHTMSDEERESSDEVEDLYVDLGRDGEDVAERVSVGDVVTMAQDTRRLGETVTGKSLDDRVCLFAVLEAAKRIDPDVTVHVAATVQEEVGLRGATALGVDLDPDLAVALDVTVANDIPQFSDASKHVTELGDGAAIKLKDGSVITNPKVRKRMESVAETEGIDYQREVLPAGGTDTAGFQNTHGAKPVAAISVPLRYMHTVTETAHLDDVDAAVALLAVFLDTETGEHDYRL